jgi:hypothetical protein
MDLSFITPMHRVELRWFMMDGAEITVPGQVQDINGDQLTVWFDRVAEGFDPLRPLREGQEAWLNVPGANNVHVVPGRVVGRLPDQDVVTIQVISEAWTDQRRQYVRELVDLPPMLAARLDKYGEPTESLQVRLVDLSAGGVRFESPTRLAKDDRVELVLQFEDAAAIRAVVTIIGVFDRYGDEVVDETSRKVIARGAFTRIREQDRSRIVQYIFRQQALKRRRTGL